MKIKKKGYWWLFGLTVVFTLLALSTVIPDAGAGKISRLGYKAHCSYAPISTFNCAALSAFTCTLRRRFFTERK